MILFHYYLWLNDIQLCISATLSLCKRLIAMVNIATLNVGKEEASMGRANFISTADSMLFFIMAMLTYISTNSRQQLPASIVRQIKIIFIVYLCNNLGKHTKLWVS